MCEVTNPAVGKIIMMRMITIATAGDTYSVADTLLSVSVLDQQPLEAGTTAIPLY